MSRRYSFVFSAVILAVLLSACTPEPSPGQRVNQAVVNLGIACAKSCDSTSEAVRFILPPGTTLFAGDEGVCARLDRRLFCARCICAQTHALLNTTTYQNVTCRFTGGDATCA